MRRMVECLTFVSCIVVLILFNTGCNKDKTGYPLISGDITLDGVSVDEGVITFYDKATGEPTGAAIVKGKYSVRLMPGEKKVEITANRVIGSKPRDPKNPTGETIEEFEQYIPQEYNRKTSLTYLVPDKNDVKDFELTSSQ